MWWENKFPYHEHHTLNLGQVRKRPEFCTCTGGSGGIGTKYGGCIIIVWKVNSISSFIFDTITEQIYWEYSGIRSARRCGVVAMERSVRSFKFWYHIGKTSPVLLFLERVRPHWRFQVHPLDKTGACGSETRTHITPSLSVTHVRASGNQYMDRKWGAYQKLGPGGWNWYMTTNTPCGGWLPSQEMVFIVSH